AGAAGETVATASIQEQAIYVVSLTIVCLPLPLAALLPLRNYPASVGLVFLWLFALDAAQQMGLTIAGTAVARPLGCSYLLFRLYDALRSAEPGWRPALLQVTAFPTLPAGPILLSGQTRIIPEPFSFRRAFYRRGIFLLALGIVKLYVALPLLDIYLETALILPLRPSLFALQNATETAVYLYARLFLDFSGYTDLVVAMCALMGLRIRHNFLRPYAAVSLRDFWRRWHITLAAFMRRHVYIPLGGRRTGSARHAVNLLAVFALLGLWHGLSLHFFLWGLLHAAYFILEIRLITPAVQALRGGGLSGLARFAQYAMTQSFVAFSWLIFFWK
ncbi:MAG: MBOAT family O-acyltransferase, partial [Leptospirales bacterium]